jgi:integrase
MDAPTINGIEWLYFHCSTANTTSLVKPEGKVSPHTLRHTAATWLMQAGTDRWQAATSAATTPNIWTR